MTHHKELRNEYIPPCVICKKIWQRKDTDKYVYHSSKGVVCRHHLGVMEEWYNDLIEEAEKEMKNG